jgi:hypothetical protein
MASFQLVIKPPKEKIKAQYNFLSVGLDYLIDLVLYLLDFIESASYFG